MELMYVVLMFSNSKNTVDVIGNQNKAQILRGLETYKQFKNFEMIVKEKNSNKIVANTYTGFNSFVKE